MGVVMATAVGDSTTVHKIAVEPLSVGTGTVADTGNANFYTSQKRIDILQTTPATTNAAGIYTATPLVYRGDAAGRGGFLFAVRFGCATGQAATTRGFCGLSSLTSAPTDVDPSTITDVLGMGWDTADSSIQIMSRTGSGTVSKTSLSALVFPIPSTDRTTVFDFEMYCPPNGSQVGWQLTNLTTSFSQGGVISSSLPAQSTMLSPRLYMSVAGVSSVIGISFMNLFISTET